MTFVGQNDYETGTGIERRIEFKPANMFFPLPKADYEKLTYNQIFQRLFEQIKDFTKTEEFKDFYYAHPGSLYFNGREIYPTLVD